MNEQIANLYVVDSTDGKTRFRINPAGYNGFGSNRPASDLRLYGAGHRQWGEGVDENFYRLLENFACPESILRPGFPMDNQELHDTFTNLSLDSGIGINHPIIGQLWYNTDKLSLNAFNGSNWRTIGAVSGSVQPPDPVIGDVWYNILIEQLMVWNGTIWISVADRYVLRSGDVMTGDLVLDSANLTVTGTTLLDGELTTTGNCNIEGNAIITGDDVVTGTSRVLSGLCIFGPSASGSPYIRVNSSSTPTMQFGRDSNITICSLQFLTSGNNIYDYEMTFSDGDGTLHEGTATLKGYTMVDRDPTLALQVATKQYVDSATGVIDLTQYVHKTGDTMSGNLIMLESAVNFTNGSNNNFLEIKNVTSPILKFFTSGNGVADFTVSASSGTTGLNQGDLLLEGFTMVDRAPTRNFQVATKKYVDDAVALGGGGGGGATTLDELLDVTVTTPTTGDILQYNSTGGQWYNVPISIQYGVVDVHSFVTAAVIEADSVIPKDDTIPQITEGVQVMSITCTPRYDDSIFRITVNAIAGGDPSFKIMTMALFDTVSTNAIATAPVLCENTNGNANFKQLTIYAEVSISSLSNKTFTVRLGKQSAGDSPAYLNAGWNGARLFGGSVRSSITVEEFRRPV